MRKPTKFEGDNAPRAKLTEREVVVILRILAAGYMTDEQVGHVYRVHPYTITLIRNGTTWRYLQRSRSLRNGNGRGASI
jgi:hypothetical protein